MPQFNLNDYIDVQTRINRFWTEYPEGAIRTQHASDPHDFEVCRYRAEVYKDRTSAAPDAVGYAFERAGSGMANKTSHEENCETSAIGRALANMGYATSGKDRPSQEEMNKALASSTPSAQPQQVQPPQSTQNAPQRPPQQPSGASGGATDRQKRALWKVSGANRDTIQAWCAEIGVGNERDLTEAQAEQILAKYGS